MTHPYMPTTVFDFYGRENKHVHTLVVTEAADGRLSYSLTRPTDTQSESMSNLQLREPWPRIHPNGMKIMTLQKKLLEALNSGLYRATLTAMGPTKGTR